MIGALPGGFEGAPAALICTGIAAATPACDPFGANIVAGVVITLVPGGPFDTTANLPALTLLSSVSSAPEAPNWVVLLAGFAGLGFAG